MLRRKCTSCGNAILKPGLKDPYVCRNCEQYTTDESRYAFLDK